MKKHAVLIPLLLTIGTGTALAASLVDGDAEDGQEKAAVCASCHGEGGNSSSAEFPDLAGQNANYILRQLKLFKSGEREDAVMQAQAAGLEEQDMKDLAVYFSQQDAEPRAVPDLELAQQGATIYRGGLPEFGVPSCAGCHGPAGMGNPAASYPRIAGQFSKYTAEQLHAYRSGERDNGDLAEIMQDVVRGLSDDQIEAVAAYVAGLTTVGPDEENTSGALLQNPPEAATEDEADEEGENADETADEGGEQDEAADAEAESDADESD